MASRTGTKRKAATTAETEFKRAKGETNLFNLKWHEHGEPLSKGFVPLVYLCDDNAAGCSKIASFDMDSTLINVKSGAKFARSKSKSNKWIDTKFLSLLDHEDWVWWHPSVPQKLQEYHKKGYRLIIFTNQGGIEKQHTKLDDIKRKCEKLIEEINAPMFVFIATGENHFRKPSTSMFDFFVENCNKKVDVRLRKIYAVDDRKKVKFLFFL